MYSLGSKLPKFENVSPVCLSVCVCVCLLVCLCVCFPVCLFATLPMAVWQDLSSTLYTICLYSFQSFWLETTLLFSVLSGGEKVTHSYLVLAVWYGDCRV